jgi:protein translocase SecG subunit
MLHTVFTISQIIICVLLIAVVLLQNKNVSLNLTSMGWWMWPVTKRWPEKVLQNLTIILWVLFVLNSLVFFFIK